LYPCGFPDRQSRPWSATGAGGFEVLIANRKTDMKGKRRTASPVTITFFFLLREEIFALIGGGRLGGWGRPCHRWRMEIESGGHPALGIPSLAR